MSHNRLGQETSPYLLQHRDNQVHWWAWGPDALAEARRTGKPILLSVGYAACHWCHVMAHESFEDEATAALMNELYVNIKVDREERPDIDAIYMGALHRFGEQGGWPLTMFLDSEARPFWGGTYFPPQQRWGKPAFSHVLREVARVYRDEPHKITANTEAVVEALRPEDHPDARASITDAALADIAGRLATAVDPVRGGLKGAPKFPQWSAFWLLWRAGVRYGLEPARAAVEITLTNICQGGIYDHVGGGFARYSVDDRWLVPHFEKMLYDNALLIDLMTEVWRETRAPLLKLRIEETVAWLEREMIADGGGFAASLDADSEGEEGKFYVWSLAEVVAVLGEERGRAFAAAYDITAAGNFEGHNIPNRLGHLPLGTAEEEAQLAVMCSELLSDRTKRVRPGWDDKVLADWNGLMIAALAHAGAVFDRPDWIALAERALRFVLDRMLLDGRLLHSYRDGRAKAPATAGDYANLIWGALRLCQVTGSTTHLDTARQLAAILDRHYWDRTTGGYCMTADDTPDVIVRLRNAHDDATPNANAVMISCLVQLYLMTGESGYLGRAEAIPHAFAADMRPSPVGHCGLLANCIDLLAPSQVVVAGDAAGAAPLVAVMHSLSLPGFVQQTVAPDVAETTAPGLAGKTMFHGKPTAYVCSATTCSEPVDDPARLVELLRRRRSAEAAG